MRFRFTVAAIVLLSPHAAFSDPITISQELDFFETVWYRNQGPAVYTPSDVSTGTFDYFDAGLGVLTDVSLRGGYRKIVNVTARNNTLDGQYLSGEFWARGFADYSLSALDVSFSTDPFQSYYASGIADGGASVTASSDYDDLFAVDLTGSLDQYVGLGTFDVTADYLVTLAANRFGYISATHITSLTLTYTYEPVSGPPTSVLEPGTLGLLGIGLAGIGLTRRRKAA